MSWSCTGVCVWCGVEILCVLIVCGGVVAILCVLWWWWCSNICVSVVVLVQVLAGLETNTASILCGEH